jgi:hypothetical protein
LNNQLNISTNEIFFFKIEYFPSQVFLQRRKKFEIFNIFKNYIIIVEVAKAMFFLFKFVKLVGDLPQEDFAKFGKRGK